MLPIATSLGVAPRADGWAGLEMLLSLILLLPSEFLKDNFQTNLIGRNYFTQFFVCSHIEIQSSLYDHT